MFERILVATRGEVASRVARTCRRLGVETVGVNVLAEPEAVHLDACDEAVVLGDQPTAYVDGGALLAAAREAEVAAIHPGCGRLAADPDFAQAAEEQGLVYVGPSSEKLRVATDRLFVRRIAEEAGVRVVPYSGPIMESNAALAAVDELDYPVRVRACRGSGEPGYAALCDDVASLHPALSSLEPLDAHDGVFVERALERARHVEVQLIFDGTEAIVLSDREVSVRRDGNRLVSEAPAPALDKLYERDAIRGALWDASTEITVGLGCRGLVSCHFVFDTENRFYFWGATLGLQTEHPTAEMCAGVDLVEMQLRIAAGESMPEELRRLEATGTALQARIYAATDPETGRPFESRVQSARWPPAPQGKVRIESGLGVGCQVSPEHDPTVATVTTYAPNRHDALLMLDRVLAEIQLAPLVTNVRLLRKVLNDQCFQAGQYDEEFLDRL